MIDAFHPPNHPVVTAWCSSGAHAIGYHSFQSASEIDRFLRTLRQLRDAAWPRQAETTAPLAPVIPLRQKRLPRRTQEGG